MNLYRSFDVSSRKSLRSWSNISNFIFSIWFILFVVHMPVFPYIAATGMLSFIFLWFIHFDDLKKFKPLAGYANLITLVRLIIVLVIGFWYIKLSDITVFIMGLTAVLMDAIDGYVAKKYHQQSEFGKHFDMEADAFYVLILTCILYLKDFFGLWIVVLGFLPYLYGFFIYLMGVADKEPKKAKFRTRIAGLFFIAILMPFVFDFGFYYPVVIVAGILLLTSFLASFIMIITSSRKET